MSSTATDTRTRKKNIHVSKGGIVVNDYVFTCDKILKHKEARQVFRKFLEKEFNTEPLDFIDELDKLRDAPFSAGSSSSPASSSASSPVMTPRAGYKRQSLPSLSTTELSEKIIKTFILPGAPKEINVTGESRQRTMETFNKRASIGLSTANPSTTSPSSPRATSASPSSPLNDTVLATKRKSGNWFANAITAIANNNAGGTAAGDGGVARSRLSGGFAHSHSAAAFAEALSIGATTPANNSSTAVSAAITSTRKRSFSGGPNVQQSVQAANDSTMQPLLKAFEDIELRMMMELERDNLSRFLRSELWLQFITAQETSVIHQLGTKREKLLLDLYNTDSFKDPIVPDLDFEVADKIAMDSYDWELQGYKNSKKKHGFSIQGYSGSINYFDNVDWMSSGSNNSSGGSIHKFTGAIPFPLETVAKVMIPLYNRSKYDSTVSDYVDYAYYTNDELRRGKYQSQVKNSCHRSVSIIISNVSLPWPLKTKRRDVSASSVLYDPIKQEIKLVSRPCEISEMSQGTSEVIDMKSLQFWHFSKIDDKSTHFSQIHFCNYFGWANSKTMQKHLVWEKAKAMRANLKKLFELEKAGKGTPFDTKFDSAARLLRDALLAKESLTVTI